MARGQPPVGVRQGAAAPVRGPRRGGRVRAASGRRSWPRVVGSAWPGPRPTAVAAPGRSSTSSCRRSWRGPGPRRWSGASASTSPGPTLMAHGTEEQQVRWLPKILDATEMWCQLFSEPGAGSDLASVSTKATAGRRRLGAQRAEGVDVLRPVRRLGRVPGPHRSRRTRSTRASRTSWSTCPTPGVEVRPLVQLTGEAEFNEVYFTDAFVPAEQLIGPRARGLAGRELDAVPRARHQPAPARDPHPAPRGAAEPGGRERRDRRRAAAAAAGRGVRRGAPVPAPQPARDHPPGQGPRPRARGQRAQALLERDEQATARHRDGRARGRPRRCGARPTDNPGGGEWQRSWLYYQAS